MIKLEVSGGTIGALDMAQQDLRTAEERLIRALAEGRIPHATEARRMIYACLLAATDASRHLQSTLASISERVY